MPAYPTSANLFGTLLDKYIQAVLKISVWGKKNDGSDTSLPVNATNVYLLDDWKRASYADVSVRKAGRPVNMKAGRAR